MSEATQERRTQEQRRAESERRIIKAASELFAQQGYLRTTLSQVGTRAGYTGGLVTHRFESKEGLLRAVVDHISTRFLEDQIGPAISLDRASDALASCIEIYLREVTIRQSRVRALYVLMGEALGSVPEIRDQIADLNRKFRNYVADIIRRGQRQGEFSKRISADDAAVLVLGLLRGVTMQVLADPKNVPLEHLIPLVKQQVTAGLSN